MTGDRQDRILRWPLDTGTRRFRFLLFAVAAVGLYLAWVTVDATAKLLALNLRPERVALAARLDPLNAVYRHILGRIAFYERQDMAAAADQYRAAARLNPYSARYWLDLALVQQILMKTGESRSSLERALAADPTNPLVAREAANYYLVLGDTQMALKLLGITVRHYPASAHDAIDLSWRATQDPQAVMNLVLPPTVDAYVLFLRVLMEHRQTEAALQAWDGLMALKQSVPMETSFPYIQYLIDEQQVERAHSAWLQVKRRNDPRHASSFDLVDNGGFEEEMVNGGFSWRYETRPHITLAIDQRDPFRGRRSLLITYDGEPVQDAGIYQLVAVVPNTDYHLSVQVKTDDLEGAGPPQFLVLDHYSGKQLLLSDAFAGTSWHEISGNLHSEPETRLLEVRVVRIPGTTRIRGKVWLDEISVVRR